MAALLLLPACGGAEAPGGDPFQSTPDDRIECRTGGAIAFERVCTVERAGRGLTVRKPDGGFRRLLVTPDGRGIAAADGAQPARVTILSDHRIEVEIGGDRFRLPATVRSR